MQIKTLKFNETLVDRILSKEKVITWRLFDDKDLCVGDELEFVNSQNGKAFANAQIINVEEKRIKDLTNEDLENNDYTEGIQQVLEVNKKYYGNNISLESIVKIIYFNIER